MVHIHISADTYGRVKSVQGTPVVTKFFAVSGFPIMPLTSYYFAGFGETKSEGIPLLFHSESKPIFGLPLARLDRLSVLMAYIRGIAGALILIGFLAIVPWIMQLTGEHLDELAVITFRGLLCCLATGIVIGIVSYLLPFQTSRRQQRIRKLCGEFLGICADPAFVRPDVARRVFDELTAAKIAPVEGSTLVGDVERRWERIERLVQLRVTAACSSDDGDRNAVERQTDELLLAIEE